MLVDGGVTPPHQKETNGSLHPVNNAGLMLLLLVVLLLLLLLMLLLLLLLLLLLWLLLLMAVPVVALAGANNDVIDGNVDELDQEANETHEQETCSYCKHKLCQLCACVGGG